MYVFPELKKRDTAIARREQGKPPFPNDNLCLLIWGEELNRLPVVQPPEPRARLKRDILNLLRANPHGLTIERIWQLLLPGQSQTKIRDAMEQMTIDGYPVMGEGWGFWTYRPEGHAPEAVQGKLAHVDK